MTTLTFEMKPIVLVLSYLGLISLKTRTKLKKSLKNFHNCCKTQIFSKNKTRLGNNFHFKDYIPKYLIFAVVYKFQCGLCNESYYVECVRHLKVKPKNSSAPTPVIYYSGAIQLAVTSSVF